jgi:hypothetical protein
MKPAVSFASCAPSDDPCSNTGSLPASSRAFRPPARELSVNSSPHSERSAPHACPFDLLVQPLQHDGRFHVIERQRQPVEGQHLLDIVFHPTEQFRVLVLPFGEPFREIAALRRCHGGRKTTAVSLSAQEVHDAGLHRGLSESDVEGFGEPLRPINTAFRMPRTLRLRSSSSVRSQNLAPSFGPIHSSRMYACGHPT